MQMTRTQNSILNLFTALAGQILSLLIGFISRYYFLHILGEYYLGINGLFTEILSMLSLVELGIGPAIIFCMYEPLAQNNLPQICGLLNFYKKVYNSPIGGKIIILMEEKAFQQGNEVSYEVIKDKNCCTSNCSCNYVYCIFCMGD